MIYKERLLDYMIICKSLLADWDFYYPVVKRKKISTKQGTISLNPSDINSLLEEIHLDLQKNDETICREHYRTIKRVVMLLESRMSQFGFYYGASMRLHKMIIRTRMHIIKETQELIEFEMKRLNQSTSDGLLAAEKDPYLFNIVREILDGSFYKRLSRFNYETMDLEALYEIRGSLVGIRSFIFRAVSRSKLLNEKAS